MLPSSSGSNRLLEIMLGANDSAAERFRAPMAAGPTLVKVSDPLQDVEDFVELLDEATPEGRRRNRWLRNRKGRGVAVDGRGRVTVEGRPCCTDLAQRIDKSLPYLPIPSDHVCPGCGTTFRIEMRVREERRHG